MSKPPFVECTLLPSAPDASGEGRGRLLGMTAIGVQAANGCSDLPVQTLSAPLLGHGSLSLEEAWQVADAGATREVAGIRFRCDGNLLYGVIEVDERRFQGEAGVPPLQAATEAVYRSIFRLIDGEAYPYLWRVWNYMGAINADERGLERYRQFNVGRQAAFVGSDRPAEGNVPAACALGVADGPLSVAFLAGRTPLMPLENPRQMSAYHYPAEYGPRSPVFSRAGLARLPGQELFFVSGTASIVGHQTVHPGNVVAQTRETLANIQALLDEAEKVSGAGCYRASGLSYRAYVRHGEDFSKVAHVVEETLGADAAVVYVQADVCRADLLVEIEAFGARRLTDA